MKPFSFLLFFICAALGKAGAQQFQLDFGLRKDTLVVYLVPDQTVTTRFSNLEFFLRWKAAGNESFAFDSIAHPSIYFPGLAVQQQTDSSLAASFVARHFVCNDRLTGTATYIKGIRYEALRVRLIGSVPTTLQLVADNSMQAPFYFAALGDPADFSPYNPTPPFRRPSGNEGPLFYLNLAPSGATLALSSFSAANENCQGVLTWVTSGFMAGESFTVEQGHDSVHLAKVAELPVVASQEVGNRYNWSLDLLPGDNYFRLQMVYPDSTTGYSPIVLVTENGCLQSGAIDFLIKGNPVTNRQLQLRITSEFARKAEILIFDFHGNLITGYNPDLPKGDSDLTLPLPPLAAGMYVVRVVSGSGGKSEKFVVQ